MRNTLLLIFIILTIPIRAFSQGITYFHKLESLAATSKSPNNLVERIDSLKQTRQQSDSYVKMLFDRDIDFGYRQQKITLTLIHFDYEVNLITKNGKIYLSSVVYPNFPQLKAYVIDTNEISRYLSLRNKLYHSTKTLNNLKYEINLYQEYAFYGGDGFKETDDSKHLDSLVKKKDVVKLTEMLRSINCEIQTYGVIGFNMLMRKGYKPSKENIAIINHIKKRNADLISFTGDVGPVILKAFDN